MKCHWCGEVTTATVLFACIRCEPDLHKLRMMRIIRCRVVGTFIFNFINFDNAVIDYAVRYGIATRETMRQYGDTYIMEAWMESVDDRNIFVGYLALKKLGRNYLGIEIDPTMAELSQLRLQNTQPPRMCGDKPKQMKMT